jgi:uncharacterized membrane protein
MAASTCLGIVALWLAGRVEAWATHTWLVFLAIVCVFTWISAVSLSGRLFPEERKEKSKMAKTAKWEHWRR